ncbi:MAG: hypothetical protein K6A14_08145 [Erysipelotrichaceae bacterium]|nr:hypothetical protein [Erysipelotrichaceae bacterium]
MRKLLTVVLGMLILMTACGCQGKSSDALRFKREYEQLNGQKDDNGKPYPEISIPEDNTVRYVDEQKICEAFENGTHVIYLGWPECGWCRRMLPVLLQTVKEYSGISVYYYSIKAARQAYEDGGDEKLAQIYLNIVEELKRDDYDLSSQLNYYDDGTIRIPSSLVFFIKEGEIIGAHKRTVESHLDSYEELTESQAKELAEIYRSYLDEMVRKVAPGCDDC